jgi:hypothetical protein
MTGRPVTIRSTSGQLGVPRPGMAVSRAEGLLAPFHWCRRIRHDIPLSARHDEVHLTEREFPSQSVQPLAS